VTASPQTAPPTAAATATPAPAVETPKADPADDKLTVLGALERGEIDVEEAMRRLGDAG
jgi:hypothetical protein